MFAQPIYERRIEKGCKFCALVMRTIEVPMRKQIAQPVADAALGATNYALHLVRRKKTELADRAKDFDVTLRDVEGRRHLRTGETFDRCGLQVGHFLLRLNMRLTSASTMRL